MRVRISYDEGVTWPISGKLYSNLTGQEAIDQRKGGYSALAKTADTHIGTLSEVHPNEHDSIEFLRFDLPWILNGATEPCVLAPAFFERTFVFARRR